MSDEIKRQVEAARQEEKIRKDTTEFFTSLGPNDEMIKPIYSPEAFIFRSKAKTAAAAGEVVKPNCTHPLAYIHQYFDEEKTLGRNKPVNLFECGRCHCILWLRDPWGDDVGDR